jgi:hypothetical protein
MMDRLNKIKARSEIYKMLECVFSKDKIDCKKCKNCENVDACCFLTEAISVYHYKEMNKGTKKYNSVS